MLLAAVIAVFGAPAAFAQTSSSTHYSVTETQFNAGQMNSCSGNYCAKASIGDAGTGTSDAANYLASFGSVTTDQPTLEMIVDPGTSNLGDLDTTHTATKTAIVRVLSYLSDGYTLQITGDPPKYGSHTLTALASPTASYAGTEQFGMNVVANTSPSVGSDPQQIPDGQTSFGVVNSGYDTANHFKYVNGDTVAHSSTQSGRTDYMISMIVNISNLTPAGHYTGDFSAVVTPTY